MAGNAPNPKLDTFSQQVADLLFSRYPQWRGKETIERNNNGAAHFTLSVPAPVQANTEHGLWISTERGELTVGFDAYHTHFSESIGDGDMFGLEYGIRFIQQILDEEIAAVSWWNNEIWRGSAQTEAGSKPDLHPEHMSDFNRVRVRSWKGALNADIKA